MKGNEKTGNTGRVSQAETEMTEEEMQHTTSLGLWQLQGMSFRIVSHFKDICELNPH